MFVRKKKNKIGSISIQIISKNGGKYKVVETIGCSSNDYEIEQLLKQANNRLLELEPNLFDFIEYTSKKQKLTNKDMRVIGDELIFGKLFKDIGCEEIDFKNAKDKEVFKALVISRLLYPGSKLYLIDYYNIYKKQKIEQNRIYRFLDKLYKDDLKLQVEKCIFNHTKKIMNETITVTFYAVTTLYFESESEDDLRRIGFSKEGKIARPQIQLDLFTTLQGYLLSYEVYEGNKYEGHTLVDVLEKFQTKFKLKNKPIVVADRGMLTNDNIAYLENNNYKYILAAKIKNISNDLKEKISKNITKSDLKLSYYAKYLDIDDKCDIKYKLNPNKISNDEKLDGIKGFITNDFTLKADEVIEHYANQYDVEKAFRISKTDLKIRPIYHRVETRIKAHILISFVSYAIYKEFERKIKSSKLDIKFKLTFDYIKTMYGYKTPFGVEPLEMDEIQQQIYDAIYLK